MEVISDKYPVVKGLVENEGATIRVESSGNLGDASDYQLYLRNKRGKELARSYSKNSINRCLAALEKNMREKLNKDYDKGRPFEVLEAKIREINLLKTKQYGSGRDRVGGFGSFSVNYVEDGKRELVEVPVSLNIGGAGNDVVGFDALQRNSWIDIDSAWVKHHLTGDEAMIGLIDAIHSYLYEKIDVRKAEMEKRKDEKGTRWREKL